MTTDPYFPSGAIIKDYALLQAAVPSACYDERDLLRQGPQTLLLPASSGFTSIQLWSADTPDDDVDWITRRNAYRGRLKAVSGNLINFFLPRDYATSFAWEVNNHVMKPPTTNHPFAYLRTNPSGQKLIKYSLLGQIDHYLDDPNEAGPFACQTWAKAVGAEGRTDGSVNSSGSVNLDATFGFDQEHSAEFNGRIQELTEFYNTLLDKFGIPRNP